MNHPHIRRQRRQDIATAVMLVVLSSAVPAGLSSAVPAGAQGRGGGRGGGGGVQDTRGAEGAPSLSALIASRADDSDLRVAGIRFDADLQQIRARYDVPLSPVRIERERRHLSGWLAQLDAFNAETLNPAGKTEYAQLRGRIQTELAGLVAQERQIEEMRPLLPFVRPLQMLQEARRDRLDVDAQRAAQTLEDARKHVLRLTAAIAGAGRPDGPTEFRSITPRAAAGAAEYLKQGLRQPLGSWYEYYYGFDPLFTWWVRVPYAELNTAIDAYAAAIEREWPATSKN